MDFSNKRDYGIQDSRFVGKMEKEAERKSDRRFLLTVSLLAALAGALVGSIATVVVEHVLK